MAEYHESERNDIVFNHLEAALNAINDSNFSGAQRVTEMVERYFTEYRGLSDKMGAALINLRNKNYEMANRLLLDILPELAKIALKTTNAAAHSPHMETLQKWASR